jgi:hypothetical protein
MAQSALETGPARLRATLTDGRQIVLREPRVQGDSLLGDTLVSEHESAHAEWAHAGIPLGFISSVSTRIASPGKTALAVVGIAAGAAVLLGILWDNGALGGY